MVSVRTRKIDQIFTGNVGLDADPKKFLHGRPLSSVTPTHFIDIRQATTIVLPGKYTTV